MLKQQKFEAGAKLMDNHRRRNSKTAGAGLLNFFRRRHQAVFYKTCAYIGDGTDI